MLRIGLHKDVLDEKCSPQGTKAGGQGLPSKVGFKSWETLPLFDVELSTRSLYQSSLKRGVLCKVSNPILQNSVRVWLMSEPPPMEAGFHNEMFCFPMSSQDWEVPRRVCSSGRNIQVVSILVVSAIIVDGRRHLTGGGLPSTAIRCDHVFPRLHRSAPRAISSSLRISVAILSGQNVTTDVPLPVGYGQAF